MNTKEKSEIRELTASELDIVTGGSVKEIAESAAKATQNASNGFAGVLSSFRDLYGSRI